MTIREEKDRIRGDVLAARRAMSEADRTRESAVIAEKLFALSAWIHSNIVGLYASEADEVSTDAIIRRAIGEGKIIALPRVLHPQSPLSEGGSEAAAEQGGLSWHVITSLDDLTIGAFGIREPRATLPTIDAQTLDLIIVPGVAFDVSCNRIGYGGGFYDRALADIRVPTVALAFASQIMPVIPTESHDRRIDRIISIDGLTTTIT